jgi:hypothetical protein
MKADPVCLAWQYFSFVQVARLFTCLTKRTACQF